MKIVMLQTPSRQNPDLPARQVERTSQDYTHLAGAACRSTVRQSQPALLGPIANEPIAYMTDHAVAQDSSEPGHGHHLLAAMLQVKTQIFWVWDQTPAETFLLCQRSLLQGRWRCKLSQRALSQLFSFQAQPLKYRCPILLGWRLFAMQRP